MLADVGRNLISEICHKLVKVARRRIRPRPFSSTQGDTPPLGDETAKGISSPPRQNLRESGFGKEEQLASATPDDSEDVHPITDDCRPKYGLRSQQNEIMAHSCNFPENDCAIHTAEMSKMEVESDEDEGAPRTPMISTLEELSELGKGFDLSRLHRRIFRAMEKARIAIRSELVGLPRPFPETSQQQK